MADAAPLTTAHAHARKAAEKTQQINWTRAADEHDLAATDYARVAKSTSDSEALRVLGLLEEQHIKLARIIKSQSLSEQHDGNYPEATQEDVAVSKHDGAQPDCVAHATVPASRAAARAQATTSTLATSRFGSSARDSSLSLARDIASRRGIPLSTRNLPSAAAQARVRQLSPESHRRNRSSMQAPKIPASVMGSQNLGSARKAKNAEDDDAFAKFYNNLTTGTMTKLSSVLAYAGLPLTADDVKSEPHTQQKLTQETVRASNEPDVKKIFSKAALQAIEDDHRQRGLYGHAFGPAESFYVVQPHGGTVSYADITKARKPSLSGIDEDDEDSFVDAREAQMPPSPRHSRLSSHSRGAFGKRATAEELELENATLKQTLEQLAVRLADFETHAQDASMAALTQSMASSMMHHPPSGSGGPANHGSAPSPDPVLLARLRQVEQQLAQQSDERQRLLHLASKQEKTLKKYQSKWEEIKQSAKEKQKAKAATAENHDRNAAVAVSVSPALAEDIAGAAVAQGEATEEEKVVVEGRVG